MTLIKSILYWFLNLFSSYPDIYQTIKVSDLLPLRLKQKTIYIVEDDGYKEQVAMLCPCSCGQVLHMNLLPDERPCWKITEHQNGTISLHPSVWRQKDCKAHFWFKEGKVFWVKDHN